MPWVNARNQAQEVIANIGGTICAAGIGGSVAGSSRVIFNVSVPSDQALPGCGREGATVTFFVDGQQAPQRATWHAGGFQALGVILGSPFAHFVILSGELEQAVAAGGSLTPYINNERCGYGTVVYSDEQQAGCGVEGSQITFKLFNSQGNLIGTANEEGTWHPWDGVGDHLQQLTLTFGPDGGLAMGNTGSGGGSQGGGNAWGTVAIALCGVGLGGIGAGVALRRKPRTP